MVNLSAVYLDSGDRYEDKATRRDYTDIKIVMNNALNGYALKGGSIKKKHMMKAINSTTERISPASSRIQGVLWSHGT